MHFETLVMQSRFAKEMITTGWKRTKKKGRKEERKEKKENKYR